MSKDKFSKIMLCSLVLVVSGCGCANRKAATTTAVPVPTVVPASAPVASSPQVAPMPAAAPVSAPSQSQSYQTVRTQPLPDSNPPPGNASAPPPAPQRDATEDTLRQTIDSCDKRIAQLDDWDKQCEAEVELRIQEAELAQTECRPIPYILEKKKAALNVLNQRKQVKQQQMDAINARDTAKYQLALHYKETGRVTEASQLLREVADSEQGFPLGAQALQQLHSIEQ
jgi:hypothetical protein